MGSGPASTSPASPSTRTLFYIEVDPTSKVLLGTPTPLGNLQRPSGDGGGGGSGGEPPVVFGDDRALIYLDVEGSEPARTMYGQRVTHAIDVAGLDGVVRTVGIWKYTGATEAPWVRLDRDVRAAAGVHELEVSLDVTDLSGTVRTAVIIVRGWDGAIDAGSSQPIQDLNEETRTGGLGDGPLPIPEFDDLVIPAVCTLIAYTIVRRRKRT